MSRQFGVVSMWTTLIFCQVNATAAAIVPSTRMESQVFSEPAARADVGRIHLYGESHGNREILNREFEIWSEHYANGMRHLFVELPYFTGQFLNQWMKESDDRTLDQVYADWKGTASHNQQTLDFYKRIKKHCPETIFHGTDVGHQYAATGARFLKVLEERNLSGSREYQLTKENIAQGIAFYRRTNWIYREDIMVSNFDREIRALNGQSIMGIYGAAHTGLGSRDFTGRIPCMAAQLRELYGSAVESVDLRLIVNRFPKRGDAVR